MDIEPQLKQIEGDGLARLTEKLTGGYNPTRVKRAKQYLSWLEKQVKQRQKTIELDGVTHSREMKDHLRREKKAFSEEYKRIKDAIEDGKLKV